MVSDNRAVRCARDVQEVGPLILRRVPVQLAHRAGLDGDLRDCDLRRDIEDGRVGDLGGTARVLRRYHFAELV